MSKIQIRPVKLREWFRPWDNLAPYIARLCILREDFFLEMHGITTDGLQDLDANSEGWRRLYFFRKSVRTIHEIRSAIETLRSNAEFKALLSTEPVATQATIDELARKMNEEYELIKQLSNDIGGHVRHEALVQALREQGHAWEGWIEVGEIAGKVRYRFAGEILQATMLPGIPEADRRAKFIEILHKMANQTSAIQLIDIIFELYCRSRGLVAKP